jgi:tetrahedral aminopeptidase
MFDLKNHLKSLITLPGQTGFEFAARSVLADAWRPLVDELTVTRLGSLHGLQRGNSAEPRPRILLAAHLDAIGLMVTAITPEGFLRVFRIGGVDPRILPGTPVAVQTEGGPLPGLVVMPPDRMLPAAARGKPVRIEHLLIDTGLHGDEVRARVHVGDPVSYDTQPLELSGDTLAGHSLDDRAALAALTACLSELKTVAHSWDVYAAATVQEEETLAGAFTSPFAIRPQIAVAVDVTHAKGPGASDWRTAPLGKGITLDWGPNTHPALYDAFKEAAERIELPYTPAVYPSGSGTDAMGMQIVAEGIPTMVISIPLRYMHTPVELIALKDVARCGRLLAEFISGLEPDFAEKKLRYPEEA